MKEILKKEDIQLLWDSTVGLERETKRVNEDGTLSDNPHSDQWGHRSYHPYILTDFAEAQLELITPPLKSSKEIQNWLAASHQIVATTNEECDELLWPLSTPAYIPDNRDLVSVAQLSDPDEVAYREHLAVYYGKDVQLISGIHYNIEFNPEVLDHRLEEAIAGTGTDLRTAKSAYYVEFGRRYLRYRWLLTYLNSATPYVSENYGTALYGKPHKQGMRSIRQSRYGYRNHPEVQVSFDSLEEFVQDIERYVEEDYLMLEKEFYSDVRFRRGAPLREMLDDGIDYIELRNFDINPLHPYGMTTEDMDFVKLFTIALLFKNEPTTMDDVNYGHALNQQTAEEDVLAPIADKDEAYMLLDLMAEVASELPNADYLLDIINDKRQQIERPDLTLSGRIFKEVQTAPSYLEYGIKLAQDYQEIYLKDNYTMHGFENFELSTQDVLKEAMRLGVKIDVIDAVDNFVRFTFKDQVHYVRNGNMTSLDSLISYFMMENKVVTKDILDDNGIAVPQGEQFNTADKAKQYYPIIKDKAIVVKPKNTNYGIGITIFNETPNQDDYNEAIDFAFEKDDTVLVEEFIEGTELRFYIENGEVLAIVERQPAFVMADGKHTVSELVDKENEHPLRGKAHFAPLTWIAKGREETSVLRDQGLTFDSIPADGEKVFLRQNSNISTGGISIDRTDEVLEEYKVHAAEAAKALGSYYCGIDMMINDWTEPASETNKYAIIEANFNPMITLHRFPGIGQERPIGLHVVYALFPELKEIDGKSK